jgi:hypothetical protein
LNSIGGFEVFEETFAFPSTVLHVLLADLGGKNVIEVMTVRVIEVAEILRAEKYSSVINHGYFGNAR